MLAKFLGTLFGSMLKECGPAFIGAMLNALKDTTEVAKPNAALDSSVNDAFGLPVNRGNPPRDSGSGTDGSKPG